MSRAKLYLHAVHFTHHIVHPISGFIVLAGAGVEVLEWVVDLIHRVQGVVR